MDSTYLEIMSQAFVDEREKLAAAGCSTPGKKIRSGGKGLGLAKGRGKGPMNLKLRQGRRPIRAAKLLEKGAGAETRIFHPTALKKLRSAGPAAAGLGLTIGGYEALKAEGKKYRTGRAVHKQMRQQRRG